MKSDYARIALQHLNETHPDVLRSLYKRDLKTLSEILEQKVNRALELDKYYSTIGIDHWQIRELINSYLAPAEELPTESKNELSELTINRILRKLGYEVY